jgi:phage/plasmid-associated DNA primase
MPPEPTVKLLTRHDDSLADILAVQPPIGIGDIVRYDHSSLNWHTWDGIIWRPDTTQKVHNLIRKRAAAWYAASDNDVEPNYGGDEAEQLCALLTDAGWFRGGRGELRKMLLPLGDMAKKDSVLRSLAIRDGIAMEGDEWDRNPWQLGCANGIVDLRDGSFTHKGDPKDLVTRSTGIDFDPEAPTPETFLRNLAEITAQADGTPDPDTAKHLLVLLGYSLWGDKTEEVFSQWPGTGRNGKGKLKDIILHVLGDYAGSLVPGFYTMSKFGSPTSNAARPDLLDILGKRIMFESEPEGGDLNIERVKKHSGRDQERARNLYSRKFVTFVPSHLTVLLTNNVLKVDKVDPALEDRLLVYPFERRFDVNTEPPADPNRLDEMKAEAQSVLALLVYACVAWYTETHTGTPHKMLQAAVTERMKVAAGKYLAANDPLRAAIGASFVRDPDAWETIAGLFDTYCEWYRQAITDDPDQVLKQLSRVDFARGLRNGLGLVETRHDHGKARGFVGIRSKSAWEMAADGQVHEGVTQVTQDI